MEIKVLFKLYIKKLIVLGDNWELIQLMRCIGNFIF